MTNYQEEYASHSRELLRDKLIKCTDKQVEVFNKMYGSIDKIAIDKMEWAYNQICLTLQLNKKKEASC